MRNKNLKTTLEKMHVGLYGYNDVPLTSTENNMRQKHTESDIRLTQTLNLTNNNSCQNKRRVHVCLILSLTLKYPDVNQTQTVRINFISLLLLSNTV